MKISWILRTKLQKKQCPIETKTDWRSKPRPNTRKTIRPSKEELEKLIWQKPTTHLSKEFNVSDKAIEKWCKQYQINKPPRGYWSNHK